MRFVEALPAWVGPDGFPLSWAHYVFGIERLDRLKAQRQLELMDAVLMAQADKEARRTWVDALKLKAGW